MIKYNIQQILHDKKSKIILIYCSHYLIYKTVELSSSFVSISLCLRLDLGKSISLM